jgi:hypothetical protein
MGGPPVLEQRRGARSGRNGALVAAVIESEDMRRLIGGGGVRQITFTVYGRPQPAGSKRAFQNKHTGRVQVVDANAKAKPWKQEITGTAVEQMLEQRFEMFPKGVPVILRVAFHSRARGALRVGP